jgi:hypothetical protein
VCLSCVCDGLYRELEAVKLTHYVESQLDTLEEIAMLKAAYVHLVLSDPRCALKFARELMERDQTSPRTRYVHNGIFLRK